MSYSMQKYFFKLYIRLLGKKQNQQGFSLVELMIVVIVILILGTIFITQFGIPAINSAHLTTAQTNINRINSAQTLYWLQSGNFATNINEIPAGVNPITEEYEYSTSITNGFALSLATPTTNYLDSLPIVSGAVKVIALPNGQSDLRSVTCVGLVGEPAVDMTNIDNETQCPNVQ